MAQQKVLVGKKQIPIDTHGEVADLWIDTFGPLRDDICQRLDCGHLLPYE